MFKSVILYTNQIKLLKRFYGNTLELKIINQATDQFTVEIGDSSLTFQQTDKPAFYHFAINIPGNQFSMMRYWIADRLTLNREEGRDEVYFPSFDADSMYFEDPAGNIVELIGRRKRDLFGELSPASFLNISEVGLVTPTVGLVGEQLQDFGIPLRSGTQVDSKALNFLGREDSYIVLVPPNRRWYFSKKLAKTYPVEIYFNDNRKIILNEKGQLSVFEK
jgi:hypothetical protein